MQEHLHSLVGLRQLVDSIIDSTNHPHAVDGHQLCRPVSARHDTQVSQSRGQEQQAASSNVDVVSLLQVRHWCYLANLD